MEEDENGFAQNLIEKLTANASLTGEERRFIMDMINSSDDKGPDLNDHLSKRIQVVIRNVKDASIQTDKVKLNGASAKKKSKNHNRMEDSFDDRRIYIFVKNPSITDIRNQYPDLFSTHEIRDELDRVFYHGKSEEFLNQIEKYAPAIFENSNSGQLRNITELAMDKVEAEQDRNYALQVGAILMLPELMLPNAGGMPVGFLKFKMKGPDEEINPYIYACANNDIKELYVKKKLYKIIAEGIEVGETHNFLEAVLVYFSCFFIFNIMYPKDDFNTLVAMERLFLNAKESEVDDYTSQMIEHLKSITS